MARSELTVTGGGLRALKGGSHAPSKMVVVEGKVCEPERQGKPPTCVRQGKILECRNRLKCASGFIPNMVVARPFPMSGGLAGPDSEH